MARLPSRAAVLAATLLAAGCATPAPPTVSLAGRACESEINVLTGRAIPLALSERSTVTLDDKAACAETKDGGRSVFAAFVLPPVPGPTLVSVTSDPIGEGLFSPHVLMLDGGGNILREIPRDSFNFHGASLKVGIRVHAGERYVLVLSDPQTVGGGLTQVQERMS